MEELREGHEIYVWGSSRRRQIEEFINLERLEVTDTPAYTMHGKVKMNYTIYQLTKSKRRRRKY